LKTEIEVNGKLYTVEITGQPSGKVQVAIDDRPVEADIAELGPGLYSILIHDTSINVRVEQKASGLRVFSGGREFLAKIVDRRKWNPKGAGLAAGGRQEITAPMPGKIIRLLVKAGDQVEPGHGIAVIEAMKMQNEIRSTKPGTVERLFVKEGQTVSAGEAIAVIS
jgi:biotin carboxyl carrier protein